MYLQHKPKPRVCTSRCFFFFYYVPGWQRCHWLCRGIKVVHFPFVTSQKYICPNYAFYRKGFGNCRQNKKKKALCWFLISDFLRDGQDTHWQWDNHWHGLKEPNKHFSDKICTRGNISFAWKKKKSWQTMGHPRNSAAHEETQWTTGKESMVLWGRAMITLADTQCGHQRGRMCSW